MSLNICYDKHDDLCHEGKYCPACEALDLQREDYEKDIEKLESKIEELELQISVLENGTT